MLLMKRKKLPSLILGTCKRPDIIDCNHECSLNIIEGKIVEKT